METPDKVHFGFPLRPSLEGHTHFHTRQIESRDCDPPQKSLSRLNAADLRPFGEPMRSLGRKPLACVRIGRFQPARWLLAGKWFLPRELRSAILSRESAELSSRARVWGEGMHVLSVFCTYYVSRDLLPRHVRDSVSLLASGIRNPKQTLISLKPWQP